MRPIALLIALLVAAVPAQAQRANPLNLSIGDQIRLTDPADGGVRLNGTVAAMNDLAIGFTVAGDPQLHIRRYADLDAIDVKRSRSTWQRAVTGAVWGIYLGTALGVIGGPFAAKSIPIDTGPAVAAFGAGGGFGGAVIGAAAGALLTPGRWYRHVFQ